MKPEVATQFAKMLGKRISDRRIEAGLTQEQVAEYLGVGNEAVSRMERGVAIPNAVRLMELADIFKCKTDDLLHGSSYRASDQAAHIEKMMEGLDQDDRMLLIGILEPLVKRLRSKK